MPSKIPQTYNAKTCVPMDPKIWDNNTDYYLPVKPRKSIYTDVGDDACIQFQLDFVGKENIGIVKGGLTQHASFGSMAYCDSPPERLFLLCYLNEVAMFYDDCDLPAVDEFDKPYQEIKGRQVLGDPKIISAKFKETFSKLAIRMEEADPIQGPVLVRFFNAWRKEESVVRGNFDHYATLADYAKERILDLGWDLMFECAIFGSGICISAEERKSVEHVFEPLLTQTTWSNDLLSWDKEYLAHQTTGERLINAIVLLQRWHGMSIEQAKGALKMKAIDAGKEYERTKAEFLASHGKLSPTLVWWFHIVETIAAAGHMWHMFSFRHQAPTGPGYINYYKKRLAEGMFKQ